MLPAATCTSRRSDAWGGALQHGMPQHKRHSLQRCVSPPRAAARLDACQQACSRLPSTACALSARLLLGKPRLLAHCNAANRADVVEQVVRGGVSSSAPVSQAPRPGPGHVMCPQAPSISASSASAHTSGSLTLGSAHQMAPNPCCSYAAMRMPLCSFTALHLALNLFPNRRQGAAVALYDPRTNGERLLATGAVEMDNPCDCLLFSASLVQAASCCTRQSVCVVRRAALRLPPWLLTASGVLWAWHNCPQWAACHVLHQGVKWGSAGIVLPSHSAAAHLVSQPAWLYWAVPGRWPSIKPL